MARIIKSDSRSTMHPERYRRFECDGHPHESGK